MLIEHVDAALAELKKDGLFRQHSRVFAQITPQVLRETGTFLQFASNDYLGLASDARLQAAVKAAMGIAGVGAGASALISGHHDLTQRLETALATFVGGEGDEGKQHCAALTFSSGFMANVGVLTALAALSKNPAQDAVIFSDALNHASIIDGAKLSGARRVVFPHANVVALREALEQAQETTKIIVTDGVFSMDGDIAPLADYLALAKEFDAWCVVDDAHAFGVLGAGRGTAAHFALEHQEYPQLVTMGTLGKAAGVAGAFVCAHPSVITWLVNRARSYIFTTAAPPLLSAAAMAALNSIATEPERRTKLQQNIAQLRAGCAGLPFRLLDSETPIQCLVVGDNVRALTLAQSLLDRGIWVPAIRPPTVPAGAARLRVSLSAAHSPAQIAQLLTALHAIANHD